MVKKQCMYSLCCNRDKPNSQIRYFPFPRPKKDREKCNRWISACGRYDDRLEFCKLTQYTHYICSEHFVGGLGPTEEHPDPVPFEETLDTLQLMYQNVDLSASNAATEESDIIDITTVKELPKHDSSIQKNEATVILVKLEPTPKSIDEMTITSYSEENEEEILPVDKPNFQVVMPNLKVDTEEAILSLVKQEMFEESSPTSFFVPTVSISKKDLSEVVYSDYIVHSLAGKPIPNGWAFSNVKNGVVFSKINLEIGIITKSFNIVNGSSRGILSVHGISLEDNEFIKHVLPEIHHVDTLFVSLEIIDTLLLCSGIYETQLVDHFDSKGKMKGVKNLFTNAVHAPDCERVLLSVRFFNGKNIATTNLCEKCVKYRKSLANGKIRSEQNSRETRNTYMSRGQLELKLKQQKQINLRLKSQIKCIKRTLHVKLKKQGHLLLHGNAKYKNN